MNRADVSCVKWVDFGEHMISTFLDVYANASYTDVTLVLADGSQLQASRMVLSMASKFFAAIFRTSFGAAAAGGESGGVGGLQDFRVIVPDVNSGIMKHVLNFIYTGTVRINGRQMADFFEACQMFQLQGMEYRDGTINGVRISGSNIVTTEEQYEYEDLQDTDEEEAVESEEAGVAMEPVAAVEAPAEVNIPTVVEVEKNETVVEVGNQYYEVLVEDLDGTSSNAESKPLESFDMTPIDEEMDATNPSDIDTSINDSGESSGLDKKPFRNCDYGTRLDDAINTIIQNGTSFRTASIQYGIPKTVLWRKAVKIPSYKVERVELPSPRKEAIEALKSGEKLLNISKRFDIPLSTLHRDKIKLFSEGCLPQNVVLKQRDKGLDFKERVLEAAQQCIDGVMSQSEACKLYKLPKTTIWRKIRAIRGEGHQKQTIKTETAVAATAEPTDSIQMMVETLEEAEASSPTVGKTEPLDEACWYNVE